MKFENIKQEMTRDPNAPPCCGYCGKEHDPNECDDQEAIKDFWDSWDEIMDFRPWEDPESAKQEDDVQN